MDHHHPWQLFPGQLVRYALDHLRRPSEFDQIVGFVLLDAGVETLLKVFLLLPEEVTQTNMSYSARKRAAEGSFHDLVRGVEEATQTAGDRLKGINLGHIEYFHSLRNKLYHAGNGITIQGDHAQQYTEIAVELLDRLLGVPLRSSLSAESRRESELERLGEELEQARTALKAQVHGLRHDLRLAIENVEPAFLMPSMELEIAGWDREARGSFLFNDPRLDERLSLLETGEELPDSCDRVVTNENATHMAKLDGAALHSLMPAPLRRFADKHQVAASTVARFLMASDVTEFLLVLAEVAFELPAGSASRVYRLAQLHTGSPMPPIPEDEIPEDHLTKTLEEVETLVSGVEKLRDTIRDAAC